MSQCCAICQEDAINMKLECCKSEYHFACLHKWFSKNNSCPLCRKEVEIFEKKQELELGSDTESSWSSVSSYVSSADGPLCMTLPRDINLSTMYPTKNKPKWLKDLRCPECQMIFRNKISLENHLKETESLNSSFSFCCNKLFGSKEAFDNHQRSNACNLRCFCCNSFNCRTNLLFDM